MAGQGEPVDELAREAVARLASDRWTERIDASSTIRELSGTLDPEHALTTLESALRDWIEASEGSDSRDGDLAEVLARFEISAMAAFFAGPRAGLGITYDQSPSSMGVRLGGTVPGFDAHEKLRDGDIVMSISGIPVQAGSMDLPVAISSHLPGETAVIELVRAGEPMEVGVELGRRVDLNSARRLNEPVVRRAWALRLDRLRGQLDQAALESDAARVVVAAPEFESPTRVRPRVADVMLGGEPGLYSARPAGVVAQPLAGNNPQAAVRAELSRLNGELAQVVRRAIDIEQTIRQIELELRMTADTPEGRAYAQRLRDRLSEMRRELAPLQQEQTRLMQERVRLIQALSQ